MGLEHCDEDPKRWVLHRTDDEHSKDCEKYPCESIPRRVFLDTNAVNLLVKRSRVVAEGKGFEFMPVHGLTPGVVVHSRENCCS